MGRLIKKGLAIAASLLLLISCDDLSAPLMASILASHGMAEYTVTFMSDEGGFVTETEIVVRENTDVEISAVAESGYGFIDWQKSGGEGTVTFGNATQDTTTISVDDGDVEILAHFAVAPGAITLNVEEGGRISYPILLGNDGSGLVVNVERDKSFLIQATADNGYDFNGWDLVTSNIIALTSDSNISTQVEVSSGNPIGTVPTATLTAQFTPEQYEVTVNDSSGPTTTTRYHGTTFSLSTDDATPGEYVYWSYSSSDGVTASFSDRYDPESEVTISGSASSFNGATITLTASYNNIKAGIRALNAVTVSKVPYATDLEVIGSNVYVGGFERIGKFVDAARLQKYTSGTSLKASSLLSFDGDTLITSLAGTSSKASSVLSLAVNSDTKDGPESAVYYFNDEKFPRTLLDMSRWDTAGDEVISIVPSAFYLERTSNIDRVRKEKDSATVSGATMTKLIHRDIESVYAIGEDGSSNPMVAYFYEKLGSTLTASPNTSALDAAASLDSASNGGDYIFVARGAYGISIYNRNGTSLSEVADPTGTAKHYMALAEVSGNYLFLVDSWNTETNYIKVYDIHRENGGMEAPELLYSRATGSTLTPRDIEVNGSSIYLLEGNRLSSYAFSTNFD